MTRGNGNAVIVIPCCADKVPVKAHEVDISYDLMARCYLDVSEPDLPTGSLRLLPGHRCLAKTGVRLQLPPNYHARILPCFDLAWETGVQALPDIIEHGNHNEIKVLLYNVGTGGTDLEYGRVVARLIISKSYPVYLTKVLESEMDKGGGDAEED